MGKALGAFRIFHDGTVKDLGDAPFGGWRIEGMDFVLVFPWGEKRYRRCSAIPGKLIMPPSEVASASNDWGIFVEIYLGDESASVENGCLDFTLPSDLLSTERTWFAAYSEHATLLSALEPNVDHEYPPAVEQMQASAQSFGSLELSSVTFAASKCAVVLHDAGLGAAATGVDNLSITLTARDLIGRARVKTLDVDVSINFCENGRLLDDNGEHVGDWRVRAGAVWLSGMKGVRLACGRQFTKHQGNWCISGWGWKDFKSTISFSVTWPAPNKA